MIPFYGKHCYINLTLYHEFLFFKNIDTMRSNEFDEKEAYMHFCFKIWEQLYLPYKLFLASMQGIIRLYEVHRSCLYAEHIGIMLEMLSAIASHASEVNSESNLHTKLHKACSLLEVSEPAVIHFESESYQSYLKLLQAILHDNPSLSENMNVESQVMLVCEKILRMYLTCAGHEPSNDVSGIDLTLHWVPLGTAKKEELEARTSLVLHVMQLLGGLEKNCFRRNLPKFFPLLANLIRCEHSSGEVQIALYDIFQSSIGPIISA